jgi:hypothetical protein
MRGREQDAIVARQYMDSLQLFQRQAKQWTGLDLTSDFPVCTV